MKQGETDRREDTTTLNLKKKVRKDVRKYFNSNTVVEERTMLSEEAENVEKIKQFKKSRDRKER